MSISDISRYRRTVVVVSFDLAGNLVRKPWVDRIRTPLTRVIRGTRQYTVKQSDTWYNLAARLYGDSRLWWIIAEYNDVIDPFTELVPGQSIALPSRNVVFFDALDFEVPDFRQGAA